MEGKNNHMKTISKKLAALILVAALGCSAASCSFGPGKWSYQTDTATISAGTWIYSTYQSYNDAVSKITEANADNEDFDVQLMDITKEKVEDKNAVDWIFDDAKDKCIGILTLEKLVKDKKVTLDQEQLQSTEDMYAQYYSYSDEAVKFYEALGVSEESFVTANVRYNYLRSELFTKIYGKDGEKEVPEEDVKKYYKENYINYYYIAYSLKTTDEEGNSVDIDAETKDKVTTNFNKYRNMLNNDKKTTDDVETQYKTDFEAESVPSSGTTTLKTTFDDAEASQMSDNLKKAIKDAKEEEAVVKTIDDTLYLIYKGSVSKLADKIKYSEDAGEKETDYVDRASVVYNMKQDEFDKYIEDEKAKLKYDTNDACLSAYSVERTVKIVKEN